MNNLKTLVHVEAEERLAKMNTMDAESEAYKANLDAVLKLTDRITKIEELDIMSKDNEIKLAQMVEDRKARKTEHRLKLTGIVVPPVVAGVFAVVFSVIERTEVNTNTATREFLKRALRLS